ncbi:MAG: MBL fold metallo-hydrolase [Paludibacteraceae bacterium]|nr:MBL fold metallo-hydrolase [Paludibacteraceae bacterium]
MKRTIFTALVLMSVAFSSTAQTSSENPYANNYIYWGYLADYKLGQASSAFTAIDDMLQTYPPQIDIALPREMALVSLDQLLHDTDNDQTEPFYTFINARMERVLKDLDRPVEKGLRIYKMYNDGFIIKSKKATVAIDVIPGGSDSKPFIKDSIIFGICDKCDALFLSHCHPDHVNLRIAKSFAARGKRVIAPKDWWVGVDPMIQPIEVENKIVDIEFGELDLTLHVLPGHQGDVYNNINVVEFHGEGTVAQTGDQWGTQDLEWIDHVHESYDIDILMPNCWINDMERHLRGFGAKMLITGHENELGEHSIDHREAYWITMKKMEQLAELNMPNVLMTWGEWYEYQR